MATGEPLIPLRHGTTLQRAQAILLHGPDPDFVEPRSPYKADGFSAARLQGPYPYGWPELVASRKALLFPDEGGPAIIEIEVPESIVLKADIGGEVRFDPGYGLEELLAAWSWLPKRMVAP